MPPKGAVAVAKNTDSPIAGVISVNPAALQAQSVKAALRLKLEVRRLPPGLTQEEFLEAIGDEWQTGKGKVDWLEFRQGKTKSPGKYPEQSRAYLHLTNESQLKPFEAKFLSITFQDAKGTHKEHALRQLPPTLGFAPSQRIPTAKQRVDGRQGTIDQDPEFIAFLEAETQPITKSAALDNAVSEKTREKVTSTPLIEALREKKANKAKAAAAKAAKRDEAKDDKATEKTPSGKAVRGGQADSKSSKMVDLAVKDAVKAANKEAAKTKGPANTPAASSTSAPASPSPAKKRERAPQNIKSMLQRDLGLNGPIKRGGKASAQGDAERATRPATTSAASDTPASRDARSPQKAQEQPLVERSNGQDTQSDTAKAVAQPTGTAKKRPAVQAAPRAPKGKPNGQAALNGQPIPKAQNQASPAAPKDQGQVSATAARPANPAQQPSPGATKAYLKHANASQGITEPLLKTTLADFGEVVSVEIDKRKGTAVAEFRSHEALKVAMAGRSLPVGQGAVEVLEYKEKSGPPSLRGGTTATRGGAGRGRGRGPSGRGGSPMPPKAAPTTTSSSVTNPGSTAPTPPSSADGT